MAQFPTTAKKSPYAEKNKTRPKLVNVNNNPGVKRYNLALPEELYAELQITAEREHTTILDLIRRSIKLGLLAIDIQNDPNAKIVIHEGSQQRELIFLA